MATPPSDLPVGRAFVVQIEARADLAAGRLAGRVEHVVSGRAARFRSLRQLVAFMDGATAVAEHRSPRVPSGSTGHARRTARRGR